MMTQMPGEGLQEELLQSDMPVLVCITARECGPCFALCLVVDDLANEYQGRAKFIKVDTTRAPEAACVDEYSPLPTMLLFWRGKLRKKLVGFHTKGSLMNQIDRLLEAGLDAESAISEEGGPDGSGCD